MDFTNNFWLIQMKFVSSQKENKNPYVLTYRVECIM